MNAKEQISPDVSICNECLKELRDSSNRRHLYPFIHCANCAPRYSITHKIPHERANTSLKGFRMCPSCQKEYAKAHSRRFHAETISCPKCGPHLSLYRANGSLLIEGEKTIEAIAKLLKRGHILALKGVGGFHLVCDATKYRVITELRARKGRPTKPFAVMFRNIFDIAKCTELTPLEEELLYSSERPIVIISKRPPHRLLKFAISCDGIAPNIATMGVMLPCSPLHVLLMEQVKIPLVFTSANRDGEPLILDSSMLLEKLQGVFDYYVDYNQEIINPCEYSVVSTFEGRIQMRRCARGYAPFVCGFPQECKEVIMAFGSARGGLSALSWGNRATLLPSSRADSSMKDTLTRLYHLRPTLFVADKSFQHNDAYFANQQREIPVIFIQYHYAHMLTLLAEHKIVEEILGVVWSWAGYGDDGSAWGGEFLRGDMRDYKRVGHFKPFRIPLECKAKEGENIALSLLFDVYGDEIYTIHHKLIENRPPKELQRIYATRTNAPLSSSLGAIFDGVAILAGILEEISFQGESSMVMEGLYNALNGEIYPYAIHGGIIELDEMIKIIASGVDSPKMVATKFINTLAHIALDMAQRYSLPVGFSGEVFMNRALCNKITQLFKSANIPYYMHERMPCNDSGIALGQVAYARILRG